jgi:hypothetical protein
MQSGIGVAVGVGASVGVGDSVGPSGVGEGFPGSFVGCSVDVGTKIGSLCPHAGRHTQSSIMAMMIKFLLILFIFPVYWIL